jgi:hypothetical protein
MENCNLIDVTALVSNIKLSESNIDFINAPRVSILDLELNLEQTQIQTYKIIF